MAPDVSPPFSLREAHGKLLLEEWAELQDAGVSPAQLSECAKALRELASCNRTEAQHRLTSFREERFAAVPALALVLRRWQERVRSDVDVPALVARFERLALVASVLGAMRRGGEG